MTYTFLFIYFSGFSIGLPFNIGIPGTTNSPGRQQGGINVQDLFGNVLGGILNPGSQNANNQLEGALAGLNNALSGSNQNSGEAQDTQSNLGDGEQAILFAGESGASNPHSPLTNEVDSSDTLDSSYPSSGRNDDDSSSVSFSLNNDDILNNLAVPYDEIMETLSNFGLNPEMLFGRDIPDNPESDKIDIRSFAEVFKPIPIPRSPRDAAAQMNSEDEISLAVIPLNENYAIELVFSDGSLKLYILVKGAFLVYIFQIFLHR